MSEASSKRSTSSTSSTEPSIQLPRRIAAYQALGLLGRGRTNNVLLALYPNSATGTDEVVVVKQPRASRAREEKHFLKMFFDEARLAARLRHPNIARVVEVGHDGELPFIATEFLDGQSLAVVRNAARAANAPVPLPVAVRIVRDLLSALAYAHEAPDLDGTPLRIVHRDVTPSNAFVQYDGISKLVDFGIAITNTQREKTGVGMIKGKMAYMAPEQFREEPVTLHVDVWAAGVLLWELVTGESLFAAANDADTIRNVVTKKVPAPSSLRADVPAALDAIVLAALERDVGKRIPSAQAFVDRLTSELGDVAKGATREAVAAWMTELFRAVIPENAKTLEAYKSTRSAEVAAGYRYLRLGDTGRMELHADGQAVPVTGDREKAKPAAAMPAPAEGAGNAARPHIVQRKSASVKSFDAEDADAAPAPRDEPAPPPARPGWQWAALAGSLATLATVLWVALAR